jgi:uncharacterized protein with HEPN domain
VKRDPKSLLWDACDAANAIAVMTAGKTFAEFAGDIVLRSAVERQFEIVGEALAQLARLDAALAAQVPDLREIVSFRNILIHGYAVINPRPRLAGGRGTLAGLARRLGSPARRASITTIAGFAESVSKQGPEEGWRGLQQWCPSFRADIARLFRVSIHNPRNES